MPGFGHPDRDIIVRKMMFQCLENFIKKPDYLTISLPAVGSGNFNYPLELSANLICGAISDFLKTLSEKSEKKIILKIVLLDGKSFDVFRNSVVNFFAKNGSFNFPEN